MTIRELLKTGLLSRRAYSVNWTSSDDLFERFCRARMNDQIRQWRIANPSGR